MLAEQAKREVAETLTHQWYPRLGIPGWPGKTPWRTTHIATAPYRHVSRIASGRNIAVVPPAPKVQRELLLPPDWMPATHDEIDCDDHQRLDDIHALWETTWRPLNVATATGRELDLMWAALQAWEQQHQTTSHGTTARRLRVDIVEAEANRRWKQTEDLNLPETRTAA